MWGVKHETLVNPKVFYPCLLSAEITEWRGDSEAWLRNLFGEIGSICVVKHGLQRRWQRTELSEGLRRSHMLLGACYRLRSEVWCLSVSDNRWAGTCRCRSWSAGGRRCSGVRYIGWVHRCSCEEREERSSWQTEVHGQSVRGSNDEALDVSLIISGLTRFEWRPFKQQGRQMYSRRRSCGCQSVHKVCETLLEGLTPFSDLWNHSFSRPSCPVWEHLYLFFMFLYSVIQVLS